MSPEQHENEAIMYGGQMGGEYLDSIGKTDLATLSADEWAEFLNCVCKNYLEKLNSIPY